MGQNNVFYNIHIAFPKQASQNEWFVRIQKNAFVKRHGSDVERLSLFRKILAHLCAVQLLECSIKNTKNLNRDVRPHADRNSRSLCHSGKCILDYTASDARRVRRSTSQNILFSERNSKQISPENILNIADAHTCKKIC